MSNAIGLRFYRVTFHEGRSKIALSNDDSRLFHGTRHLLHEFLTKHTTVTNVDDAKRGWFFESPLPPDGQSVSGRITYGIHGIVSRFVDITDRKEKFKRGASDLEEVPLYYRLFLPKSERYLIFVFQSYGIRSCVGLVQSAFANYIRMKTGLNVRFRKLMPADAGIEPFAAGLVKEMTLIKRGVSSDKVDSYRNDAPGEYDVKVSLLARGKTNFGLYRDLSPSKVRKAGYSVALVDDFDKATLKVAMNGSTKVITVFGDQGEAGTIDVTDDDDLIIEEGHPTVMSLDNVVKPLLTHFNDALVGYGS